MTKINYMLTCLLVLFSCMFVHKVSAEAEQKFLTLPLRDSVVGELTNDTSQILYRMDVPYTSDLYLAAYLGNNNRLNEMYQDYYSLEIFDSNMKSLMASSKSSFRDEKDLFFQSLEMNVKRGTYYVSIQKKQGYYFSANQQYRVYTDSEFYSDLAIQEVKKSSLTGTNHVPVTFTPEVNKKGVEYQFSINQKIIQPFSPKESSTWTPTKSGSYEIEIEIRDETYHDVSTMKKFTYVVSDGEISVSSLKANVKTPQLTKKTIQFTTVAKGQNLQYRYQVYSNKKWNTVQNYSTKKTYNWKSTKAGTYKIKVIVKNTVSGKTASKTMNYVIYNGTVSISSLKSSIKTPQPIKKTIQFTASAKGEPIHYQFELYQNKKWKMVQSYSTKKTYNWKPTKAGTYKMKIIVKNTVSGKTASKTVTYKVFKPSKFSIVSLKADKNKNLKAAIKKGKTVNFTVKTKGSYLEYRYRVYQNKKWVTVQDYSTKKTYTWKATKKGIYQIAVDVRQVGTTKKVTKSIKAIRVK